MGPNREAGPRLSTRLRHPIGRCYFFAPFDHADGDSSAYPLGVAATRLFGPTTGLVKTS